MMKRILAASASTAVALTAGAVFAPPATAQGPVVTGGLVNVTIVDVIDDITVVVQDVNVGVALALAANICDVNVLAQQLGGSDDATCESDAGTVVISQD